MLSGSALSSHAFGTVVSVTLSGCSFAVSSTTFSPLSLGCSLSVDCAAGSEGVLAAGVDVEPSDAMLSRVVVALAGRDLLDAACRRVSWREGFRLCFGWSSRWRWEEEEEATLATFLADMLSRATSVTGAALEALEPAGQVPGYRF